MANVCDGFCKGCAFYEPYSVTCNYFLKTGQLRPCPAGTGCTVKETGKHRSAWRHESDATWKNATKAKEKPSALYRRECKNCDAVFETNDHRKVYCCKECASKARSRTYYKRTKQKEAPVVYHRECKHCGAPFETTIKKKIYCSAKCNNLVKTRAAYERYKAKKAAAQA